MKYIKISIAKSGKTKSAVRLRVVPDNYFLIFYLQIFFSLCLPSALLYDSEFRYNFIPAVKKTYIAYLEA